MVLLIFLSENTLVANNYICSIEFTLTIELLSTVRPLLAVGRLVLAVTQADKKAVTTVCIKFCKFRV
jgi:hypothetical protein